MNVRGVIFDLDGVLCSTDEYHYLAWKAIADEEGIPFDRTVNHRLRGVSRAESLEIILSYTEKVYTNEEKARLAERKNALYRNYLAGMTADDLDPEVLCTLQELRRRGVALAVGSSSKNTPLILRRIGLGDFFDAVADGNDITRSKPDPEVFLLAAERLRLSPRECLVVEDAESGIEAGRRGGFRTVAIGEAAKSADADYFIEALPKLLEIVFQ